MVGIIMAWNLAKNSKLLIRICSVKNCYFKGLELKVIDEYRVDVIKQIELKIAGQSRGFGY